MAALSAPLARAYGPIHHLPPCQVPTRRLVFTDVAHGIFRSSPFFLAIQQAYANDGVPEKAELFFKLHELQTCSWGASKIGDPNPDPDPNPDY